MKKEVYYQYYVEGESEKCLINALKTKLRCIVPGKVERFNVIQDIFNNSRLRSLKTGTNIILVYDTDTNDIANLRKNIAFLKKQTAIANVFCIPQVYNLEQELVFSCDIRRAGELTQCQTIKDFKRTFIACTNIDVRLKKCRFSMDRLWSRIPENNFCVFGNDSKQIRIHPEHLQDDVHK